MSSTIDPSLLVVDDSRFQVFPLTSLLTLLGL